jgi:hypothetical protein
MKAKSITSPRATSRLKAKPLNSEEKKRAISSGVSKLPYNGKTPSVSKLPYRGEERTLTKMSKKK